jgi:ferrous iron transport protein B
LERNLYLVVQIIELGAKVLVALNMSDVANDRGIKIDVEKLSRGLEIPIIPTIASKEIGLEELKLAITNSITSNGGIQ